MTNKKFTLSIKSKVVLTVAAAVIANVVTGFVGVAGLQKVQRSLEESLSIRAENIEVIRSAAVDLHQMLAAERALFVFEPGTKEFAAQLEEFKKQQASEERRFKEYLGNKLGLPDEEKLIGVYEQAAAAYRKSTEGFIKDLSSSDAQVRLASIRALYGEGFEVFDEMEGALDDIGDYYFDDNEKMLENVKSEYSRLLLRTGILMLLCIGVTSLLGYLIIRSVNRPILMLRENVRRMAEGDLTVTARVYAADELGGLSSDFNTMTDRVRSLIGTVQHSVQNVSGSSEELTTISQATTATSEEIGRAIQEIAAGASRQASLAESTNQRTLQLSGIIEQVTEGNHKMNELSVEADHVISGGMERVKQLQEHTRESGDSNAVVSGKIHELASKMNEISSILQTINNISEQTKLLALNASIEAARAGESGRGFGVVASEIHKLAMHSFEATQEIKETVVSLETGFSAALKAMDNTARIVGDQGRIVKDTGGAFDTMAATFRSIVASIQAMNRDMDQMHALKEQVVEDIQGMSHVASDAAAATEQISASSAEQLTAFSMLHKAAQELKQLSVSVDAEIRKFHIG
ncbi:MULTISPECIES: methyl-accepting chemotaxis protein [Paenibacillus]|uniref:methyl-accepting chemotaxis protein n=1 Tax=Paenibacillus TaxID=44249 RepID=UPI0022B8E19E|nr:methyl-accepting chemotaxis protein [Paenibacillus caseinilyticus]MCZ8519785.1 methyl-accepting chemotaxis protein [Paenibacillus caseinilyticus]